MLVFLCYNKYVMCIDIMGSTKTVYKNDFEVSYGENVKKKMKYKPASILKIILWPHTL